MAPPVAQQLLLSPAELSYLHTSLTSNPPIRPDGRTRTQFRPLIAEADIIPSTNGSARICFADGTEAIVGIKAEVERSAGEGLTAGDVGGFKGANEDANGRHAKRRGKEAMAQGAEDTERATSTPRDPGSGCLEFTVEIPGLREDDGMPIFMAAMLSEALCSGSGLTRKLFINRRWHWKLYIDILLLSQPSSYPLPLLSLTTHLALASTRLPKLKSERDEDPLFDDDWDASTYIYGSSGFDGSTNAKPPVTLLAMAIEENIIFDPSAEELAVADSVLAVSVAEVSHGALRRDHDNVPDVDSDASKEARSFKLLAIRTIDPPSRMTYPGTPNFMNTAAGGTAAETNEKAMRQRETMHEQGVWQPPRGGMKRKLVTRMIHEILKPGGVAEEVFDGLDAVELG